MDTITLHAAKTNLSKLVKRAAAGEEIIIACGKVPMAKLVPLTPPVFDAEAAKARGYGIWKDKISFPDSFFFDPLPDEELALWYGEGKE